MFTRYKHKTHSRIDTHRYTMKIRNEVESRIRRIIRDSVVLEPLISLRQLQDILDRRGFKIASLHYIAKLKDKVHKESLTEIDRAKIAPRISETRERYRLIFNQLNKIAFWSPDPTNPQMPPSYKDQIAALRALGQMDLALLNSEMDAGIFTRHIGTIEEQRRFVPLPPEQVDLIMGAFRAWGIGPTALNTTRKVEAKVVKVYNIKPAHGADQTKRDTAGPKLVG